MVLLNNQTIAPFLGAKLSYVTGLDPLGLQNASEQAYSSLLPGLNNVTRQVRAYSFYCWLLQEYAAVIESTDPAEQKKFIRKAEYIVSLLSYLTGIEGVSGIQYASHIVDEGHEIFDLDAGTYNKAGKTDGTYWKYSFGIFGQYFLGSLRQIGLIEEPVGTDGNGLGIYRRTKRAEEVPVSGEDLAEAFEEALPAKIKELYLRSIHEAIIDREGLVRLSEYFNLREIKIHSQEWKLLLQLLLSSDEPRLNAEQHTTMRKKTLMDVLQFAKDSQSFPNERAFTNWAYDIRGRAQNKTQDSCLTGWYYYHLNEYWQYACTAILHGTIAELEVQAGPGWVPLNQFVSSLQQRVIEWLQENRFINESVQTISDFIDVVELEEENILQAQIKASAGLDRICWSLMLVLKLYSANKPELSTLKQYAEQKEWSLRQDILYFLSKLNNDLDKALDRFIKSFLIQYIIQRHRDVAFRKQRGTNQSTAKFLIEDGKIRVIDNFEPGNTGPRIGNLMLYLQDMQLLTDDNSITDAGKNCLKTLRL